MRVYTVTPRRFGEDAIPKELRYFVATARAGGERVFAVDLRPCSPYLHVAARHALAAMKREEKIAFFVPCERFTPDDVGAAYLLSRDPSLADECVVRERAEGVFLVSL